jgi:hypothetical protein
MLICIINIYRQIHFSRKALNKYNNYIIYIPSLSSQLSWNIFKQFSSRNMLGFTFQDVVREFPEKNRVHLARILADMVDKVPM